MKLGQKSRLIRGNIPLSVLTAPLLVGILPPLGVRAGPRLRRPPSAPLRARVAASPATPRTNRPSPRATTPSAAPSDRSLGHYEASRSSTPEQPASVLRQARLAPKKVSVIPNATLMVLYAMGCSLLYANRVICPLLLVIHNSVQLCKKNVMFL